MNRVRNSAYLDSANRLGDVIAAIQVMAIYKYHSLKIAEWADIISGGRKTSKYWEAIFLSHPEFFMLQDDSACLVWRRSHKKTYHVDYERNLSKEELDRLSNTIRNSRVSKAPLSSEEIATLINAAINLHARAVEQAREHRWLSTPLFSLLGVILGVAITQMFK